MSIYKSLSLGGNAGPIANVEGTTDNIQLVRLGLVMEVVAATTDELDQGFIKFRFTDSK